jgi:hypothetical protein
MFGRKNPDSEEKKWEDEVHLEDLAVMTLTNTGMMMMIGVVICNVYVTDIMSGLYFHIPHQEYFHLATVMT